MTPPRPAILLPHPGPDQSALLDSYQSAADIGLPPSWDKKGQPMNETKFSCMRDIGKAIGWTSHEVGKLLKRLGLRTSEGKPSREAFEKGLVAQKFDNYGHYLWAWNREDRKSTRLNSSH